MPRRAVGFAAVFLSPARAGTIPSSSGSASVAPTPRRNVRRGRCLWVMIIPYSKIPNSKFLVTCEARKRRAPDDSEDERRPAIVVRRRVVHDSPDGWRIVVLQPASERVGQKPLGDGRCKPIAAGLEVALEPSR